MKIFISYARADDETFVRRLYRSLEDSGFEVWWDRERMESRGQTFHQEIRDAIAESDRVLVVVGPAALSSSYVQNEWEHALLYAKAVTPILRIGNYGQIPEELRKYHCTNFTEDVRWDSAVEELLRILRTPVLPLGPILSSMPSLPPNFLARCDLLSELRNRILPDVQKGELVDDDARITGIFGIGGVGKTSMAIAIARSVEVRRAFNDGIIWLTVEPRTKAAALLRQIGGALGDSPHYYVDAESGRARLAQILEEKSCLVVMDNVWEVTHVAQVRSALGMRARLLVTTRDGGVLTALGVQPLEVETFDDRYALALLALWANQTIDELSSEASSVAARVGNLPLALALCGALYRDGLRWEAIFSLLDAANMEALAREFPDYPHPDVFRAFQVSYDQLVRRAPRSAARYRELVVFTKGPTPTTEAISLLWKVTAKLSAAETERILVDLSRRALIRLRKESGHVSIELHPLLQDFICSMINEGTANLHAQLLQGCKEKYSDGWYACSVDPYLVQKLPYHMKAAGCMADLRALLMDKRWLASKIQREGVVETVSDFALIVGDEGLDALSRALELSAAQLEQDNGQLVQHVWARTVGSVETGVVSLRDKFVEVGTGPWLRTLRLSFEPVDSPLCWSITLEEHPFSLAVSRDGTIAYLGGKDSIAVVDIKQRRKLRNLTGLQGNVYGLSISPDGKLLASSTSEGDLRVWDLEQDRMAFWAEVYSSGSVKDQLSAMSWFPDSQHIATGSILGGSLAVWNVFTLGQGSTCRMQSQGLARTLSKIIDGPCSDQNPIVCMERPHKHHVNALAISHDGNLLVSAGSDGNVKLWDASCLGASPVSDGPGVALPLIGSISSGSSSVGAVALSEDSRVLFFGSSDGKVRLWDFDHEVSDVVGEGKWRVTELLVARKQGRVISGGGDSIIRVYGLGKGEPQVALQGHGSPITSIAQLGESSQILSCSGDRTFKLWNLKNAKPTNVIHRHKAEVLCVALSSDETSCLSVSRDGEVMRWSLNHMNVIGKYGGHEFWVPKGMVVESSCQMVAATSNGKTAFAGNDDGSIVEWRLDKSRPHHTVRPPDPYRRDFEERYKRDSRMLYSSLANGEYERLVIRLPCSVMKIAVTGDGRWLAWAERDHSLKIIKLGGAKVGLVNLTPSVDGVVSALAFSPDSRSLCVAMASGTIQVWNMRSSKWMEPYQGVLKCPSAVAVSSDLKYAVTGDHDGRVVVLELGRENPVATLFLENSVKCCAISQPSNCIVVGDSSGSVHMLRLEGAAEWGAEECSSSLLARIFRRLGLVLGGG